MGSCADESIGRQVYICGQAMRNYADHKLKKYDLTIEQLHILKELSLTEGQTQSQLGEEASKGAANITRILDRLEKKNRISRRQNPDDRRSILVFLTEEGEQLLADARDLFEDFRSDVVAGISYEKQKITIDVIKKILENVDALTEK